MAGAALVRASTEQELRATYHERGWLGPFSDPQTAPPSCCCYTHVTQEGTEHPVSKALLATRAVEWVALCQPG